MKRIAAWALLALALLAVVPAWSGTARGVRKQAESSLRVTGTITIERDGTVLAHTLDPETRLSPVLEDFIGKSLAQWRFEPVKMNGEVVVAKVPMSLRLVAKRSDDGKYSVRIVSTHFGASKSPVATDDPQAAKMDPPAFPREAARVRGKGVVYLIVQFGADGKVMNVDAEQVNLRVAGTDSQMKELRKQFTDASIRAARQWVFVPPSTGEEAGRSDWLVRVPVEFKFFGEPDLKPGDWDTYIPGPRNTDMPWAHEQLKTAGSPDALPDSGVYSLREGAKLLTPPTA